LESGSWASKARREIQVHTGILPVVTLA
jgi:hypothetical protein